MKLFLITILLLSVVVAFSILQKKSSKSQTPESDPKISDSFTENSTSKATSFIEGLRQREYEPSQITIENTLSNSGDYSSYIISYISDGLKIYGRMNVPSGNPPAQGFPVIMLNHGYFNTSSFTSGDGTQTMADILAGSGYLTLASDYRGFGKSENDGQGSRGHRPEYAIDVLNLIASVKNVDKADFNNIGMWGHSMGGEVSLRVAEATDKVKAIVLWAPTSGRVSDNARFYGGGRSAQSGNNPDDEGTSPIDYLQYITAPISLHQGLTDTEVSPEWSNELNESLLKENINVEYFEYPGQDHNFVNLGWDIISQRTIEFYNRYLK